MKPLGLLYTGNCLEVLKSIPDESVQCCITSPPYYGLRDYRICGCRQGRVPSKTSTMTSSQAGTPSEFGPSDPACPKCAGTGYTSGLESIWGGAPGCIHSFVMSFRRIQSGRTQNGAQDPVQTSVESGMCTLCDAWFGCLGNEPTPEMYVRHITEICQEVYRSLRQDGTFWLNLGDSYRVGKQLLGIPWRVAFSLQDAGWILRQDIVYSKRNPMPESITDRCVRSHEYVFLLTKSPEYYFDHIAIHEPAVEYAKGRRSVSLGNKSLSKAQAVGGGVPASGNALKDVVGLASTRNKRSVWTLSSQPSKIAHFAAFPEALVTPMILAGTSEHGACSECRTPYKRIIRKDTENLSNAAIAGSVITGKGHPSDQVREDHDIRNGPVSTITTIGWEKKCACVGIGIVPCDILDPFSGTATTGKVALENGRCYTGIDANSAYTEAARNRLVSVGLDVEVL